MNEHKLTGVSLETELTVRGLEAIYRALERQPAVMTLMECQDDSRPILERPVVPLERAWKGWRAEQ